MPLIPEQLKDDLLNNITNIINNISDSYSAVETKGGVIPLPEEQNSGNLPNTILSIPIKITDSKYITQNGVYSAVDEDIDGYDQVTVNVSAPLELVTPDIIYDKTRPKCLPKLTEDNVFPDNRIELLVYSYVGSSAFIAINVSTSSGQYKVDIYDSNNIFIKTTNVNSGVVYSDEILGSLGAVPLNGSRVFFIFVITPVTSGANLISFSHANHPSIGAIFRNWNIYEFKGKCSMMTNLSCGASTGNLALRNLNYFTLLGENRITVFGSMFYNCTSLITIRNLYCAFSSTNAVNWMVNCISLVVLPDIDWSRMTNVNSAFLNCYSLVQMGNINTSNCTSFDSFLSGCSSLKTIAALDTSKGVTLNNIFNNCQVLEFIPELNTSLNEALSGAFFNCRTLHIIPPLDMSKVTSLTNTFNGCGVEKIELENTLSITNITNAFANGLNLKKVGGLNFRNLTIASGAFSVCPSLETIEFISDGWVGADIAFLNCSLSRQAIVDIFNALPVISVTRTITIVGNPGTNLLTSNDRLIATSKNWSITG